MAPSSRSQVVESAGSASVVPTWGASSISIPRRPLLTTLVTLCETVRWIVCEPFPAVTGSRKGEVGGSRKLVGVAGFEPAASSSRTKRAAKLRYTPPAPNPSVPRETSTV